MQQIEIEYFLKEFPGLQNKQKRLFVTDSSIIIEGTVGDYKKPQEILPVQKEEEKIQVPIVEKIEEKVQIPVCLHKVENKVKQEEVQDIFFAIRETIKQYGPCTVFGLYKNVVKFNSEFKIGIIKFYFLLKRSGLNSLKKQLRYYRST